MAIPAKHYSVRRLAEERWGCSVSHVYDLIDSHELKALRIGKSYRIPAAFVEEYEAEHQAWDENAERKPSTGSDNMADIGISAGPKAESLSASQRGALSADMRQNFSLITSRD